MAILTTEQLTKLRQAISRDHTARWTKGQANLAFQAIENWFEVNKAGGSTAINNATAPFVFTGAEKKVLFAHWLLTKHQLER